MIDRGAEDRLERKRASGSVVQKEMRITTRGFSEKVLSNLGAKDRISGGSCGMRGGVLNPKMTRNQKPRA